MKLCPTLASYSKINSRAIKPSSHCFPLEFSDPETPHHISEWHHLDISSHSNFSFPRSYSDPRTIASRWSHAMRDLPNMKSVKETLKYSLCVLLPTCGHIFVLNQPQIPQTPWSGGCGNVHSWLPVNSS